jgi:hypothetical protein
MILLGRLSQSTCRGGRWVFSALMVNPRRWTLPETRTVVRARTFPAKASNAGPLQREKYLQKTGFVPCIPVSGPGTSGTFQLAAAVVTQPAWLLGA